MLLFISCMFSHSTVGRHRRCSGRQIFKGAKDFSPNLPKLARKNFGPLFVRIFSHEDRFWDDIQKTVSMWFCTCQAHFFQIKARWMPFLLVFLGTLPIFSEIFRMFQRFSQIMPRFPQVLPGFSGTLPIFSPNQKFWGALAPPPPTSLVVTVLLHYLLNMPAFNSHMRQNPFFRNFKWTFEDSLLCYCYAIKTNSRTMCSQVLQPASVDRGVDMSELQAHHCITP